MTHAAPWRPRAETDTWVRSALEVLADVPGVLRVGVALAEGGGRQLLFAASDRDNEPVVDWCRVDAYDDVPLNNAVRTGRLVVGSLADLAGRYPEFVARQRRGTQALASVPLSAAGQVVGGFALFYEATQPFDGPQLETLRELGESLGEDLRRGRRAPDLIDRSLDEEPLPAGARAATLTVAAAPRAVAPARQFVRRTLVAWGIPRDVLDSAVLCVSELVTNSIIHTAAGCEVRVMLHQGVLTTTVRDRGAPVGHPEGSQADALAVRGRGLQIVDAVSARWGSELDPVGMTVWCELQVG